jgi:hypothetical protein
MTSAEAMARAVAVLEHAERVAEMDRQAAEALVTIADGWRRLSQTIHHQPGPRPMPRPRPPRRSMTVQEVSGQ